MPINNKKYSKNNKLSPPKEENYEQQSEKKISFGFENKND